MSEMSSTQTGCIIAALAALSLASASGRAAYAQMGPDQGAARSISAPAAGLPAKRLSVPSPRKIARKARSSSAFAPGSQPITSIVAPHSPHANRPLARPLKQRSASFTAAALSPASSSQASRSLKSRRAAASVQS